MLNFLDDDDQFYPNHVGLLAARLRSRPELVAACAGQRSADLDPVRQPPGLHGATGAPVRRRAVFLRALWCQNFLPIQSVMFRRKLFLLHGGFDLELDRLEDWNLWCRYFTSGKVELIDQVTSFFRVPTAAADQLQRNAMMDLYFALAVRKRQDLYARLNKCSARPSRGKSTSTSCRDCRFNRAFAAGLTAFPSPSPS